MGSEEGLSFYKDHLNMIEAVLNPASEDDRFFQAMVDGGISILPM